jgi:fatty acid desaturase
VFLEFGWFRHFHLAHHRYTNEPDNDPELAGPRPRTTWEYVRYLSGLPEWASRVRLLVRSALRPNEDSFVPLHGKSSVKRGARVQLVLYLSLLGASLLTRSTELVFVWLIPLLLGGPFLRAYLLAEHGGCPHVASMFHNTRTTFTNTVVRFIAWNMPYHAEHHAYPAVPFHKLAELHSHTKPHLACTEDGYLRFNKKYFASRRESLR